MTGLLTERDVLVLMGWPCREFINARIRSDRFPRPALRYRGVGDQWRRSDIDAWQSGIAGGVKSGEQALLERFS